MNAKPYSRIRAIIEHAEETEPHGRINHGTNTVGALLVARLRATKTGALKITATSSEVGHLRKSAKSHLEVGERVSIYRLDPHAGRASRVSTWEAVLIRPGKNIELGGNPGAEAHPKSRGVWDAY